MKLQKLPRVVLALTLILACVGVTRAQDDDDVGNRFFDMLIQQYRDQTGDSIQGYVSSDDPETLANVMFEAGKYSDAIVQFDRVVRKYPTGWNYFRRGFSCYMVKRYQQAIEDFTRSVARFPAPMLSPWWVGATVFQDAESKRYPKGTSISLKYQYIDAYFYRAESKMMLDDYYGCISDIENYFANMDTGAKRFPHIENSAHRLSGYCKLKTEDFEGAVQDFRAAVKIDDEDGSAHYYLGVALLDLDQVPEGCRSLSRAGELGMTDAYETIRNHCGSGR
mgnify:CR=1 FL=1